MHFQCGALTKSAICRHASGYRPYRSGPRNRQRGHARPGPDRLADRQVLVSAPLLAAPPELTEERRDGRHLVPGLLLRLLPGEPALVPASDGILHRRRGARRSLVQPERSARPRRYEEDRQRGIPPALQRLQSRHRREAHAQCRKRQPFPRPRYYLLRRQERLGSLGHRGGPGPQKQARRRAQRRRTQRPSGDLPQGVQLHANPRRRRRRQYRGHPRPPAGRHVPARNQQSRTIRSFTPTA